MFYIRHISTTFPTVVQVSHKLVARKFNVSVSTISYILKKRKKIEEAAELNEGKDASFVQSVGLVDCNAAGPG